MAWRRYAYHVMALITSQLSALRSVETFYFEGMLGVTIRFDSYHDAEEHLCRVTEVTNAANYYSVILETSSIVI